MCACVRETSGGWRAVRPGRPSTPACSVLSAASPPGRSPRGNSPTPRCIRMTPDAAADSLFGSPGILGYTVVPGDRCLAAVRTLPGWGVRPGSGGPAADWSLAGPVFGGWAVPSAGALPCLSASFVVRDSDHPSDVHLGCRQRGRSRMASWECKAAAAAACGRHWGGR